MPDIDLDFPRDIREKLIPRVHERYGERALGAGRGLRHLPLARRDPRPRQGARPAAGRDRAGRADGRHVRPPRFGRERHGRGDRRGAGRVAALAGAARLAREAWGLPRHPSQHPGGMVISTRPLIDLCPVQPAAMEGRQIVQWDKDSCADAGFLKIDLLGLGMLSAVERCVDEIARARGERIDLSRIPLDDPEVYEAIQAAETTGVFQIESRAQMQMLPRTLPENLDDLTVQVALVRPGPIQGGAVHPYIERRKRLREDPAFRGPLRAPVARAGPARHARRDRLPGPGDRGGDGARRLQRRRGRGAAAGDEPQALGGGDPRLPRALRRRRDGARGGDARWPSGSSSRSAASPASASRRRTRPPSACSPTSRPGCGSTTGPSSSARCSTSSRWASTRPTRWSTRRSGAGSRSWRRTSTAARSSARSSARERRVLRSGVRIGLGYVTGLREDEVAALVAERERGGPYRDLADLASRSGAGRDGLERLAWAGACEALGGRDDLRRREDLWQLGVARRRAAAGGCTGARQLALPLALPAAPALRELDSWERLVADYASTGIALAEHPMALLRPSLEPRCRSSADLERSRDGRARGGRRAGRRPPAAGDRKGRGLHAARGRAGDDQPDRPAAGLRAPPPGGADGLVRAGERASSSAARG